MRLARRGVLFANHWANAAPCGPSRACLYTGTYQHRNRSVLNGTPLDARFTNVALLPGNWVRPRPLRPHRYRGRPADGPPGDPRALQLRGGPTRFRAVAHDPWEEGSPALGSLAGRSGFRRASNPHALYEPMADFPGSDDTRSHVGAGPVPRRDLSQTDFVGQAVTGWLEDNGGRPFFVHASFIRPHPPRRNPIGYHDLYEAEQIGPFVGCARPEDEAAIHPLPAMVRPCPRSGHRATIGIAARPGPRTTGPNARSTTAWVALFDYLEESGLRHRRWSSSPATTAKWAATTGCSRSWAIGTRATTSP